MIYCFCSHLADRRCLQMQVVTLLSPAKRWGDAFFFASPDANAEGGMFYDAE